MTKIKLRSAYAWNCPVCLQVNVCEQFIREVEPETPDEPVSVSYEPTIDDEAELSTFGFFEVGPRHAGKLACCSCSKIFEVEPPEQILP